MVRITFIWQRSNNNKLQLCFHDSRKYLRCRSSHQQFTIYARITLFMFPKFIQIAYIRGRWGEGGGGGYIWELIFGLLIGLHIWGRIFGGWGRINEIFGPFWAIFVTIKIFKNPTTSSLFVIYGKMLSSIKIK